MNNLKWPLFLLTTVSLFFMTACSDSDDDRIVFNEKVDDWEYSEADSYDKAHTYNYNSGNYNSGVGGISPTWKPQNLPSSIGAAPEMMMAPSSVMSESIGFSVGGAKDVANFRENIKKGYLPLPSDITYEGLFYDYYFDTGKQKECEELFCPSYTSAISADPFSKNDDYYLAVGLNSNIKESDFARKKLNLVIVLDISGSMGSGFSDYYYDGGSSFFGSGEQKSKMEIANEAIVDLLGHLNDDDRFGMVVFDDAAYLAKNMSFVGETKMGEIKKHILDLTEQGGTNMSAGMDLGTELFAELKTADRDEYENRIIFLTDAMPNTGDISKSGMMGMTEENADDGIYGTFIGVGVDFNTDLIENITKIRGANYYSVHSAQEFKKRMDEEFEYMVTPLVFDLELKLDADGYDIEQVYGSPEADQSTGEIMKVNTLFPSPTEGGETRGGIVLLKLAKTSGKSALELSVSYEDRSGETHTGSEKIRFQSGDAEYFENDGIRKAVLLARYADLMKDWIIDERKYMKIGGPIIMPMADMERGIMVPPHHYDLPNILGQWERQSAELRVSGAYQRLFGLFKDYFEDEMKEIGDKDLEQEIDVMDVLIDLEDGGGAGDGAGGDGSGGDGWLLDR